VTLNNVDYVILYVRDLARSVAFYRDVVGLPHKFTDSGYAEFATAGTKFALFDRAALPDLIGREVDGAGPWGEVAFLVDDVDAQAERIRGAGVPILSGPTDRPWGQRTLHFLDPEDHVLEFAQELAREER
jgi:lactoylglutathione lyase